MIEVTNLKIEVSEKVLVDEISFKLSENYSLGIIGSSGSGKTLTSLSLMGLLDTDIYKISGSIKLFGEEIIGISEKEMAKKRLSEISFVYQNPFNTFSPVEKIKNQFDRIYKIKKLKKDNEKIRRLLEEVSLNESHLEKFPYELSGGELQRLVIVTALLLNPKVLICDEPTTALDVEVGEKIIELLNTIRKKEKLSLIFVTHDLSIIGNITERLIIMNNGKIVESGKTEEILMSPKDEYTKKLLSYSRLGD
ncbi:ABC transporter ATP-binding protein [Parvimonas sp. D9]|uniref:ABC transporter ATP-binding protein n=1 Tax=Parvimonas sp. D9 TaxID=3110689 RepID=UPI002B47233A|nr:ABC transporter ATP-binding protein [Parvimonas sp. D9]MEB3058767.1 ABC transporter ATP-binding protein [Parvimonas sp. D9]